uniref:Methyltransferase type 11 domain-containing protein n=1 Tax=Musa acuminata subsp. malaccensis TaxID=214687 RepID=A0A804IML8_MUSAM
MAGLFVKQAAIYAEARPMYPWFSKLASFTSHHKLVWDVGTSNDQATISVVDHYEQVMATDVSEAQLKHGTRDPKFHYIHTPLSTSDDELVLMDLMTVAQAVHWFNLPRFYSVVKRVLRNPGGVIAVWGYNYRVSSLEDTAKRFLDTTLPCLDPRARYVIDGYRNLPFLSKSVGMGGEGNPNILDMVVLDDEGNNNDGILTNVICSRVTSPRSRRPRSYGGRLPSSDLTAPDRSKPKRRPRHITILQEPGPSRNANADVRRYPMYDPAPYKQAHQETDDGPATDHRDLLGNLPGIDQRLYWPRDHSVKMLTLTLDVTFDRFWGLMRSWSAVATAREQGVELLSEDVVKKLESDRGGSSEVTTITHKVPMPVGTSEQDHMVFDKMLVLLL